METIFIYSVDVLNNESKNIEANLLLVDHDEVREVINNAIRNGDTISSVNVTMYDRTGNVIAERDITRLVNTTTIGGGMHYFYAEPDDAKFLYRMADRYEFYFHDTTRTDDMGRILCVANTEGFRYIRHNGIEVSIADPEAAEAMGWTDWDELDEFLN